MAKVLIVEDDPLVSRMYQKVLKFEGFEVVSAEDGQSGVDKAKEIKPDLILLDIMMPKMNGIEMLEIMKSDNDIAPIPVVMLTNLSGTQDAENAMKRGAADYLVKSQFKPKEVAEKVKKMLSGSSSTPTATQQNQAASDDKVVEKTQSAEESSSSEDN